MSDIRRVTYFYNATKSDSRNNMICSYNDDSRDFTKGLY